MTSNQREPGDPDRQHGPHLIAPVTVVAGVLVLLGIVAVATSRGHDAELGRAPSGVVDYAYTTWISIALVTLGALIALFVVYVRLSRVGRVGPPPSLISSFLALAMVVLLGIVLAESNRRPNLEADPPALQGEGSGENGSQDSPLSQPARFRWEIPIALGVLAMAGGCYVMLRQRRRASTEEGSSVASDLYRVVDETLEDLLAEPDARRAVIAAYARMEHTLTRHGSPRSAADAPFEYVARVLRDLDVPPLAISELTDLFERAKFSSHEIEATMKERAIDALVVIRDKLRATA